MFQIKEGWNFDSFYFWQVSWWKIMPHKGGEIFEQTVLKKTADDRSSDHIQ